MDIIEFFKTIKYPDFPNDITSHFEQSVALYNLLKGINHQGIVAISVEGLDPDSINFKIKTDKETRDITEYLADSYCHSRNYSTAYDIEVAGKTRSSISIRIKETSRV